MLFSLLTIFTISLSSYTQAEGKSLEEKIVEKKEKGILKVKQKRMELGFIGEPLTKQEESTYLIAHGKVESFPAMQIATPNQKVTAFFVTLQPSKSYEEAKKKCAQLKPIGKWILFAESAQYLELLAHKNLFTRQAVLANDSDENIYAAWLRPNSKAMANAFKVNGYPYIGILADGKGTSTYYYDTRDNGAKARLLATWQFGGGEDKWLDEKHTQALRKKIQSGLATFCQAGKIHEDAPASFDGSGTQD